MKIDRFESYPQLYNLAGGSRLFFFTGGIILRKKIEPGLIVNDYVINKVDSVTIKGIVRIFCECECVFCGSAGRRRWGSIKELKHSCCFPKEFICEICGSNNSALGTIKYCSDACACIARKRRLEGYSSDRARRKPDEYRANALRYYNKNKVKVMSKRVYKTAAKANTVVGVSELEIAAVSLSSAMLSNCSRKEEIIKERIEYAREILRKQEN